MPERRLRRAHSQGEEPADLPAVQPTKLWIVINLKAAKAVGLSIPEGFLLRAEGLLGEPGTPRRRK
jgi:hypothetical protein